MRTPTTFILMWLCLDCTSIDVAPPPNRKRHQVAFLLAFSHDENLYLWFGNGLNNQLSDRFSRVATHFINIMPLEGEMTMRADSIPLN